MKKLKSIYELNKKITVLSICSVFSLLGVMGTCVVKPMFPQTYLAKEVETEKIEVATATETLEEFKAVNQDINKTVSEKAEKVKEEIKKEEEAKKAEEEKAKQEAAEKASESTTNTKEYTASIPAWNGSVLTPSMGVNYGPSGKETYYNLPMQGVISIMRGMGNTDEYWVREDGVKMLGDYVMVAADLSLRPRGSLVETSLGTGIVCDTGAFTANNRTQIDIAVAW